MNAEELIITQYEIVKLKKFEQKKASECYSNCLNKSNDGVTCIGALITDIRESGNKLEPDEFDNAVQAHCCKFCQNGWNSSKLVRAMKKKLAGLKQSMHALAKRLLKEKQKSNHVNPADAKSSAADQHRF